ncbi:MAG: FAD-binding oxidoreductase, partial [Pseudomonadota bacterium]
ASAKPIDRLTHAYGKSFPDTARAFQGIFPHSPDCVIYPETEDQIEAVFDWAVGARVAVIPFGGGTSVCGGVECDVGAAYAGAVSLDLGRLNRVIEVDKTARAALIEAGATGPHFDGVLKQQGLTLRHFPQSYMFASLGGMIATRSGGHYATRLTHIDEMVEALTLLTPSGRMETRRLPGSGAGPQPERMVSGSEGTLGVISKAWMRLQDVPVHKQSRTARFATFGAGAEAARALAQSGLDPSNCRLIDAAEAHLNGAGDGHSALLVLGFESADHPQTAKLERALELCRDYGGDIDPPSERSSGSDAWRTAFLRMPYWREVLVPCGVIIDTFETACLWSEFEAFHGGVTADMHAAIREVTGQDGLVTCRFTHLYPDGPAPYFTFFARSSPGAMLDHWTAIKQVANRSVVSRGGTVTHHHAVGRDHRSGGYDAERSPTFAKALQGMKAALDPAAILNPGVLFDPAGAAPHIGGAVG